MHIGEIGVTCDGYSMKVVAWRSSIDIDVLIDAKHLRTGIIYANFKKGQVKNLYHPCVYGKGYFGEGPYTARVNGKLSVRYSTWVSMLGRCYDVKTQQSFPTYAGCAVCDDWLNYQVFSEWYEANYYELPDESTELDKDILVSGNKLYSPATCVFAPHWVNSLIGYRRIKSSATPSGVYMQRKSYVAALNTTVRGEKLRERYLGSYTTAAEAFSVYKKAKETRIKEVADIYKELIPHNLYEALYRYEVLAQ